MTWVIGMHGFPSQGVMVADTAFTLRYGDGREEMKGIGVQKIYAVASNIALGFSGNIDAGMKFVGDAKWDLAQGAIPRGSMLPEPNRFLVHWARRARWGWRNRLTDAERVGGCSLLWMAARPPVSPIGWTPVSAFVLRAPEFKPEPIPWRVARSIGSGSDVATYAAALEELGRDYGNVLRFDVGPFQPLGGSALPITLSLTEAIEKHATPGVNKHLVVCSVAWGSVRFGTNERTTLDPTPVRREMPPIATNWAEWQALKRDFGIAAALASG